MSTQANLQTLVDLVQESTGCDQKTARRMVKATIAAMASALKGGTRLQVAELGSFIRTQTPAGTYTHPKDGTKGKKVPKHTIRFRPSTAFLTDAIGADRTVAQPADSAS